jgi:nitrate reductase gamma subunit
VLTGVTALAVRRLFVPSVRATTSPVDWLALILLLVIIVTGIIPTIAVNLVGPDMTTARRSAYVSADCSSASLT